MARTVYTVRAADHRAGVTVRRVSLSGPLASYDRRAEETPAVGRHHADDRHPVANPEARVFVLGHARQIDPDTGPTVRLHDHLLSADPLHEPIDADDLHLGNDWGQRGPGPERQSHDHEQR